jgi:hypothetical protein
LTIHEVTGDLADEIDADAIRQTFPKWRIFSQGERWWAIRGGIEEWTGPGSLIRRTLRAQTLLRLAEMRRPAEWAMCVNADTPSQLRAQLNRQEELNGELGLSGG